MFTRQQRPATSTCPAGQSAVASISPVKVSRNKSKAHAPVEPDDGHAECSPKRRESLSASARTVHENFDFFLARDRRVSRP